MCHSFDSSTVYVTKQPPAFFLSPTFPGFPLDQWNQSLKVVGFLNVVEGAWGSDCIGVVARVEELGGSSRAEVYTENLKAGTYMKS